MAEDLAFFRVEIEMALENELELDADDEGPPRTANGDDQRVGGTA